jgi:hypothetical protein
MEYQALNQLETTLAWASMDWAFAMDSIAAGAALLLIHHNKGI